MEAPGDAASSVAAIVPAAGAGRRFGGDKLWADVAGRPLLAWTLGAVAAAALFDRIVVAVAADSADRVREVCDGVLPAGDVHLVQGGARRQDSVRAALQACTDAAIVCVHDAARPLCPPGVFAAVVDAARRHGAATAVVPVIDSVKRVGEDGVVRETVDRSALRAVQTPQAFAGSLLRTAHERGAGVLVDDDCALVELLGHPVHTVDGDRRNLKVTTADDLVVVRALLGVP